MLSAMLYLQPHDHRYWSAWSGW